jgi:hypothetical protein
LVLEAQTAPIRFAERAAQVKRMFEGRRYRGAVVNHEEKKIKIKLNYDMQK